MAPMALGDDSTIAGNHVFRNVDIEDVVIAGAGPAGLMLA